jgi:hypothetical protein
MACVVVVDAHVTAHPRSDTTLPLPLEISTRVVVVVAVVAATTLSRGAA